MVYIEQKVLDRFNSFYKVSENGCKIWTNYLDKDGYGSFYFFKKLRRAHRFSYFITHGEIPKGMVIDHVCKNRNCVEVTHLRLVTSKQNSLENSKSVGAINSQKTNCKFGHPLDRKYGKQRYCSTCQAEKTKRLRKKWLVEANKIGC